MGEALAVRLSNAAAFFGVMSLLGVAGFHFPDHLTTPQLRELYTESQLRFVLGVGLGASFLSGFAGLLLGRSKRAAALGLSCAFLALMAGGNSVPLQGPVQGAGFYLSLDWLLLDLLLIGSMFIAIEKSSRLRPEQQALRHDWQLDLKHYVVSHLAGGGIVFVVSLPAATLSDLIGLESVRQQTSALPLLVQVPAIMLVTDLTQYWVHRASHTWPLLWRFHQVHHSVEVMDWLAGSRLHLVDILLTRSISLVPMVLLGFSNEAINIYLPILALQSVFIHSNVNFELGRVSRVIATPQFHHWHHTGDAVANHHNFAVTFPLFDLLFGTYHCPKGEWPVTYGLPASPFENSYLSHLLTPFRLAGRATPPQVGAARD